jgi:hypothetical protein
MEGQRVALRDNSHGLQPEKALVLETIGPIKDFIKAVKNMDGLEWMGEFEVDEILPAYGFQDEKNTEKELKGRLFLVMTDQRALGELQRLFRIWRDNPEAPFPRGLAPLKKAFVHLYDIRPWNAEDRIRETGLLEDWRFRLDHDPSFVPFEAELWFHEKPNRRRQGEAFIREVVREAGGEVLGQCVIPEIAYHAVLGNIPATRAEAVLRRDEVRLLHCEDVMFLRPVGQCAAVFPGEHSGAEVPGAEEPGRDRPEPPPAGNPLVALFDGLPLTRHRSLEDRIVVDDPDGYEADYSAGDRKHGTAMASLICRGDLNETGDPLSRAVYVRPIMRPRRDLDGRGWESIPEDVLPVDLVHRAVRRLFESEGDEPPAAPTVRAINLSIGDSARPLDMGMSPWARLLDCWKTEKAMCFPCRFRYLCLLAILCEPGPPALICIEEPELGLHPDILPKIADLLIEASERTQLIATPHSDILVDAMTEDPESVVVVEKHDRQTRMERLRNEGALREMLEKYRLGELWMSGEITHTSPSPPPTSAASADGQPRSSRRAPSIPGCGTWTGFSV